MPKDQFSMHNSADQYFPGAPEAKCQISAGKSLNECWTQSQYVLLSWSFDIAESMHVFSRLRLRSRSDTWKALMSFSNPAEFVEVQQEYVENATAQYRDYAQCVSKQMRQCANDMARINSRKSQGIALVHDRNLDDCLTGTVAQGLPK